MQTVPNQQLLEWINENIQSLEKELEKLKALRDLVTRGPPEGTISLAPTPAPPKPTEEPSLPPEQAPAPAPQKQSLQPVAEREKYEIVSKKDGKLLGIANIETTQMTIIPKVTLERIPPFSSFFEGRILEEMRAKDLDQFDAGTIPPEAILDWSVECEQDGKITKVVIRGLDGTSRDRRIREIVSAFKWTAEKMLENRAANLSGRLG